MQRAFRTPAGSATPWATSTGQDRHHPKVKNAKCGWSINPALASLEQTGLIEQRGVFLGSGIAGWALSDYGGLFLQHLLTDLGGWPPREQLPSRGG